MNDPKDIILSISLDKVKEDNSLNQSNELEEEKNENIELNDESKFNILIIHLNENLSKKLYKKTVKDVETVIESKYLEGCTCIWKIIIIKIRAYLKVIKKKIVKYLIYHYEKAKIKNHILSIKNYFKKTLDEFNSFLYNLDEKNNNNLEMIDGLLLCYFEFIYLNAFFNNKIGIVINAVAYLSFILRLYKETHLVPKSVDTFNKMEKCFILLSQILIFNEDYFSSIEYLNIGMDLCLKDIIYQTKDLSEGVFQGDKKKFKLIINKLDDSIRAQKSDDENIYCDNKMTKVIINIVCIYFYRGICYENIGKIKNSTRCYTQCLWFLDHFLFNKYTNLTNLIKKILKKSLEFKETIDYLNKKIFYYEHVKLRMKNQKGKDKDKDKKKSAKNLYSKKFKRLVSKIDKFKIKEIDTVNKFEIKKNIKSLNSVRREGKDKNIFLSDIRLLNTYLREDFRGVIDNMDQIKSYDLDYQTRDKIQKLIRNMYFEQNQRKLRMKLKAKNKNAFNRSALAFNNSNRIEKIENEEKNNKRYELLDNINNNKQKIMQKIMVHSTFAKEKKDSTIFPKTCKSFTKINQSVNFRNISSKLNNKNNSELYLESKKRENLKRYKLSRINSAGPTSKSKIYEENKELNSFFNKKYTSKRNYIKKLEERELTFQKNVLRLKNIPKTPIQMYNREIVKQNANDSFQKMINLLISTPMNWKEQMSEEEVKEIMNYDKLQNAVLKSLDKIALIRYKEEEKKQKSKSYHNINDVNLSIKNVNNNNKHLLDKLDINLEELRQREILENNNYKKILIENRKNLKHKEGHNCCSSCIVCRRIFENTSRNGNLKKSNSSPYFYS